MLIAYAGKPRYSHRERAYALFQFGRDTATIAKMMDVSEASILRWITLRRSAELGLPNPYERKE